MQTKTNSWSRSSIVRKQQELIANKGLDTTTIQSEERYAVQNKLGEGGMGQVYKTTDLDLKRPVALKTLKAEFAQDRDQLLQFIQEAQSTGRLEHPSIPPVHELGLSDEGLVYFTMKLVNGVTLSEVITKLREGDRETHRRFSFDYRAQVMIALCQAVHFANTSGVFHRDIKPRGERPEEPDFIGTPAYAAPERFGDPDAACIATSEVFSLGVVMYELFTLKTAYEAKSMRELISQVMGTDLPPAYKAQSPFQTPCPAEYSHIIRRATLRNEKERIENAGVLGEEIQLALQNMSAVVCPCTGVKRVLSVLDRIVNAWGGAGAAFVFIWQILPFILVALLLWQHLK
jgi:eukaryotic-like serine/threonine-protein kinase